MRILIVEDERSLREALVDLLTKRGFAIDAVRWPKTAAFVERTLAHDCFARFKPFEDAQLSTDPKGRRAALLAAGAPLCETSVGTRQPVKGMMRL